VTVCRIEFPTRYPAVAPNRTDTMTTATIPVFIPLQNRTGRIYAYFAEHRSSAIKRPWA